MTHSLVSVIITCFNYGKYLGRCVDSALQQSYPNLEIIVVDDGSIDNTEVVMAGYLENMRVTYLRQENRGQAVAKNVGIERSRGEFVAFLDADDLWCPDKLEKQMLLFKDQGIGVVYCRAKYLDEKSDILEYNMTSRYLQPQRGIVTGWLFFDNFVQFSSTVVRKTCLERFGFFDESLKMGIDWDLWLRVSTAYRFDYIAEPLFYYRMGHAGQMSKNLEERHRCSDRIMAKFLECYPHAVPIEILRKAQAYTACIRGDYYRWLDRKRSYAYYLDALRTNPREITAFKGMLKNFFKKRS